MHKKLTWVLRFSAAGLLILSVVLPAVATANTNIIGGADWPTFWFHFQRTSYLLWLAGALVLVERFLKIKKFRDRS